MDGIDPDVRSFWTTAAAFHSAALATDLGVPTRMRLLHDVLFWNICPSRDPACRVVVSFKCFVLHSLDLTRMHTGCFGWPRGRGDVFRFTLLPLVHCRMHGVD